MLDSGCSRAIISAANAEDCVQGTWSSGNRVPEQTAAGIVNSVGTATAKIPFVGEVKDVIVMKDCPNMIGLGHVVENLGFEFS